MEKNKEKLDLIGLNVSKGLEIIKNICITKLDRDNLEDLQDIQWDTTNLIGELQKRIEYLEKK